MLVFKAILTIEGMGRTLDPDFDLMAAGRDLVGEIVKRQYSMDRIGKDLLWVAKDAAALLQVLPRQIRWMFRKFNANDFAFEIKVPEMDRLRHQIDRSARRLSVSVLAGGLFIASSLALQQNSGQRILNYPVLTVIYFVVGAILVLRFFLKR